MNKIAFVITKSNWGGAQRYVYDLATSLDPTLYETLVILGGDGPLKTKLEEAGIRTIQLNSLQRDVDVKKEWQSLKELYKILRTEKPDVVHLNSSKAGGLGALVCRIARIKHIIFTAHAWAFNENRSIFHKIPIALLHYITVVLAHRTIAVSEKIRDQITHFPFINHKIKVIHLGIHEEPFFSKEEARVALHMETRKGEVVVGTIAELHPVKGLLYALDSIALMKEKDPDMYQKISYFIIGTGQEKERIIEHVKKRRIEGKVHLLGFIPHGARYLKAFDIFLLPSLSEAFGYVLIESGLAKVPVIATKVGGIPEIIKNRKNGLLIESKNARAIKNALEEMMEHKKEAKKYAETLYENVTDSFSLKGMIEKTLDIYDISK